MSRFNILRSALRGTILTAAIFSVAACTSNGSGGIGASGGGSEPSGPGPSATSLQLGVTGDNGTTQTLGIAALTDPILGTTGLLGGGGGGLIGGILPGDMLTPLSSQLAPVANQVATALPLSTVTDSVPGLGVIGGGGLINDLIQQDPLNDLIGTSGLIAGVIGNGNDGLLGDIIPAGTVPSLPLPSLTGTLTGLTSGVPLGAVTSILTQKSNLIGSLTSALPIDAGNQANGLSNVTGLTDTLTTIVNSTPLGNATGTATNLVDPSILTGLTSQITGN